MWLEHNELLPGIWYIILKYKSCYVKNILMYYKFTRLSWCPSKISLNTHGLVLTLKFKLILL